MHNFIIGTAGGSGSDSETDFTNHNSDSGGGSGPTMNVFRAKNLTLSHSHHSSSSFDSWSSNTTIIIGICAMAKKTKSRAMDEIITRLRKPVNFEVVIFKESMIKNQPVEEWPHCTVLLAWFSAGFPLDKAQAYRDLHNPIVLNDIDMQWTIMNRGEIYDICKQFDIDVPRYEIVDRSDPNKQPDFKECDDYRVDMSKSRGVTHHVR